MKKFWITWHYSQRSRNFAKDLNVPILEYVNEISLFMRHFVSSVWTGYTLIKYRPTTIYLQYSYLLLIILSAYKILNPKPVRIICDCHTKALRRRLDGQWGRVFWNIKRVSFSYTELCIISNSGLEPDMKRLTNKYFILNDKIPQLKYAVNKRDNKIYCVFASSFAADEPLNEVVQMAEMLNDEVEIVCTGKIPNNLSHLKCQPHVNIYYTDYLRDDEYIDLIANAQCIIALTTENDCLQCAGYEALAVGVPLIVSNTTALKEYFEDAAVYVDNEKESILNAVRYSLMNSIDLRRRMEVLKEKRIREYEAQIYELKKCLAASF